MIDGALPYLRCPSCGERLARHERTLRCPRRHSFDLARQGYADLTGGRVPHEGDSAPMLADRAAFLAAGHYDFIAEALTEYIPEGLRFSAPPAGPGAGSSTAADGLVVDAGTGTGAYLARVLDAAPGATGLGLDVSKAALRRAARAHPRAAAVRADLWRTLPVADASAELILNVFAPRNGPEFHRILRTGGRLVVVTPAPEHLRELVAGYGLIRVDPEKAGRVRAALGAGFATESHRTLSRDLELSAAEVRTLIGMTPSARHVPAGMPPGRHRVAAAVDVAAYRRV